MMLNESLQQELLTRMSRADALRYGVLYHVDAENPPQFDSDPAAALALLKAITEDFEYVVSMTIVAKNIRCQIDDDSGVFLKRGVGLSDTVPSALTRALAKLWVV